MKYFTKFAAIPALVCVCSVPMAAPATAGDDYQDIVVRSQAAMEEWQADVTKDINRSLIRRPLARSARPNNAVVQITFTIGDDGKADNIEMLNGNGNWAARKAAMYAVKRLNNLDTVPVNNAKAAQFLANIIFADTVDIHEDLKADLREMERARIAAAGGKSRIILLGG